MYDTLYNFMISMIFTLTCVSVSLIRIAYVVIQLLLVITY